MANSGTHSPKEDCEFKYSSAGFCDFYLWRQRWMKLQLAGWAATCLSSEVGTLTTQPLGINSGHDLGGLVWKQKSLNHLISSDDSELADHANQSPRKT